MVAVLRLEDREETAAIQYLDLLQLPWVVVAQAGVVLAAIQEDREDLVVLEAEEVEVIRLHRTLEDRVQQVKETAEALDSTLVEVIFLVVGVGVLLELAKASMLLVLPVLVETGELVQIIA